MGTKSYGIQNFLLELEGRAVGRLSAMSGGAMAAEVAEHGEGAFVNKHIVGMKIEDMVFTCGTGMSRIFYDWIGSAFASTVIRKDGAVIWLSDGLKPVHKVQFMGALVTGLVMPELKRSENGKATMMVTISPEATRTIKVEDIVKTGVYISSLPKSWNIADFRLSIDGLEAECRYVTKIGSLKLGRKAVIIAEGHQREATKSTTKTEFSNLDLRLPEDRAAGFVDWFQDVVKGNMREKKGMLEFFAPNSKTPYFGIKFEGLGIMKTQVSSASGKSSLPIDVSLYCERMEFFAGAAAVA